MSTDQDMPKWDVALAALAADEYRRTGKPLTLDDFRNLAKTYSIRLDDIIETMLLLAVNREWAYTDPAGIVREINQDRLDSLFKKRRLNEDDLANIDGTWQPAGE